MPIIVEPTPTVQLGSIIGNVYGATSYTYQAQVNFADGTRSTASASSIYATGSPKLGVILPVTVTLINDSTHATVNDATGVGPGQFMWQEVTTTSHSNLVGNLTATATNLQVVNGSLFPAGPGQIIIDDEVMFYTSRTGNFLGGLNRSGQNYSVSHTTGTTVYYIAIWQVRSVATNTIQFNNTSNMRADVAKIESAPNSIFVNNNPATWLETPTTVDVYRMGGPNTPNGLIGSYNYTANATTFLYDLGQTAGSPSSPPGAIVKGTFPDTETLSETFAKDVSKVLSDTVVLDDYIMNSLIHPTSDSESMTDAITILANKGLPETQAMSEALVKNAGKSLIDTEVMTETFAKNVSKVLSDNVFLGEIFNAGPTRNVGDPLALDEIFAKDVSTPLDDSQTLDEGFTKLIGKQFFDFVNLGDSLIKLVNKHLEDSTLMQEWVTIRLIKGEEWETPLPPTVTWETPAEPSPNKWHGQ